MKCNRRKEKVYLLEMTDFVYDYDCSSNLSEESKQQNSELSEQLKLSTQENGAMRLEVEDLRKRLEIADLMLQQVHLNTG